MNKFYLDEIMALNDLNHLQGGEAVNLLGSLYELGRVEEDISILNKALEFGRKIDLNILSDDEQALFHFNTANGYVYLYRLKHLLKTEAFWVFESPEFENELIHLRKAVTCSEKTTNKVLLSEIYSNLGNTLDTLGRYSEAIPYWQKALKVRPGFGMAVGNLGKGIGQYGYHLFDLRQKLIFAQYAYKYMLEGADSKDIEEYAIPLFLNGAAQFEFYFGKELLLDIQDQSGFNLGASKEEEQYRKWCVQSVLFLNPLNDILLENVVAHDILHLPVMTAPLDAPPVYFSLIQPNQAGICKCKIFAL